MISSKASGALIIRRYQPADREQVHSVYRNGMEFNKRNFLNGLATTPVMVIPLLSFATIVDWLTSKRYSRHVSLVAAVSAGVIPFAGFYLYFRSKYLGFIERNLKDSDLNEIERVYNDHSCFLVAVDRANQRIVGTAGAKAIDKDGVFELRRMFVDTNQHRRGIARNLLAILEAEIHPRLLYLTCHSKQYEAHGFYRSTGFILKDVYSPPTVNILIRSLFRVQYIDLRRSSV